MVHVLSGQWPFPGEAVRLNPNNPSNPDDVIGVTEFNRREEYINLIEKQHPLMTLIQRCLSNSPSHRPSSSDVHQRLSAVVAENPLSFANRLEMMERIKALNHEKEDMRVRVSELQVEVGRLQIALPSTNQMSVAHTSNSVSLSSRETFSFKQPGSTSFPLGTRLKFTNLHEMPLPLDGANLVHVKGYIYANCKYHDSGDVLQYSICSDQWKTLPKPPIIHSTICSILGKVLLIGGWICGITPLRSGSIHELDGASKRWIRTTSSIPPMPTARSLATVVSWTSPQALIVCGGENEQEIAVDVVEVYHTLTLQWHTVSPLPFSCSRIMHTVIHDSLYLVGGHQSYFHSTKSVIVMYSISDLLKQCVQSLEKASSTICSGQWHYLLNTPNYCTGTATLGGNLLAIGGQSKPYAGGVFSSIHAFSPSTSSWVHIGDLPRPHTDCGAITLPSGELLVIGGEEENFASSKVVYKGSIIF